MPIQTDMKISPYFDDFDVNKDYYKILFRPGVPVQVRELNQLQTILQKQIERFGDNVLKRGTVVEGCEPTFFPDIDYVKIKDTQAATSAAVNVVDYEGLMAMNPAGLVSEIIHTKAGFEGTDPDLNTLYLKYLNFTGNAASNSYSVSYENDNVLTLFNKDKRVHSINVSVRASGFLATDLVVIYPAIEVQNTTGGSTFLDAFTPGDTLVYAGSETVVVVSSNATANSAALVLQVKPTSTALSTSNTINWNLAAGSSLIHSANGQEVVLAGFVGAGASANVVLTAGATEIQGMNMHTYGTSYYVAPTVSVASNTAGITNINLLAAQALLYEAKVEVANTTIAPQGGIVGTAYGMSINDGIVYQKGYFQRVDPQFLIVEKYSNTPHEVAVGFSTVESIVDFRQDSSLVDNAAGFLNENAPGANRFKLTPVLAVKTEAQADEDLEFFSIYKFSEGKIWSQSTQTEYNKIRNELALRTFEESGNYVLDRFEMTTRSTLSIANSDTHFTYLVDPGHAYINGYRLKTNTEYAKYAEKATTSVASTNTAFDLVYGNYVYVNEFAGLHDFSIAEFVSLRSANAGFLTTDGAAAIPSPGVEIGKARIRSIVYDQGTPGTPAAIYKLYLFDIKMNSGKNFRDVKAIKSTEGIADIILEAVPGASNTALCKLYEPEKNSLLIDTKLPLKIANDVTYRFRTVKSDVMYPGGSSIGTIIVADDPASDIRLPYSGALTTEEKQQIIVIPEADIISTANIAGSVSGTGTALTGTSTDFVNALRAGDYIYADSKIVRVEKIASSVSLTYSPSQTIAGGSNVAICFPDNVPIDLTRATRTATSTASALTLSFGAGMVVSGNTNVKVIVNEEFFNSDPITKTVNRNAFVLIQANTHVNGVNGPWSLGLPDVFRLNAVYAGSNSGATDITSNFYIEDGQRDNYYDLACLKKDPQSTYVVGPDDVILVEFGVLTHASGIKTVTSYPLNDETRLANLASEIHTLEIAEFTDQSYHDLRACFDFRPLAANTVAVAVTEGAAPTNPKWYGPTANASHVADSNKFVGTGRKFPVPEGDLFISYTEYQPRVDTVLINSAGEFEFLIGENRSSGTPTELLLYKAYVPPYPSLAQNLSRDMNDIINKRLFSQGVELSTRRQNFTIDINSIEDQIPGYDMKAIHALRARIQMLEDAECCVKESGIADKIIPSSQDAKLERYKFGFFVDDFNDTSLTDVGNRSNLSNIYNGNMYPKTTQYDIKLRLAERDGSNTVSKLKFPYTNEVIINQKGATDGPVIVPAQVVVPVPAPVVKPLTTVQATTPTAPVANVTSVTVTNAPKVAVNNAFIISPDEYRKAISPAQHITDFVFSSNTQAAGHQVNLYYQNLNPVGDVIKVYQYTDQFNVGTARVILNTAVTNTSGVTALTTEDITKLRNKNLTFPGIGAGNTWSSTASPANDGNTGYLINNGKLVFNYDPTFGRKFRVIVSKIGSALSGFCYYIEYPDDQFVAAVAQTIVTPIVSPPPTFIYVPPQLTLRPALRKEPTTIGSSSSVAWQTYVKKINDFQTERLVGGLARLSWTIQNVQGGEYKVFYKNIDITKYCEAVQWTNDGPRFVKNLIQDKNIVWANDYEATLTFYPSELILLGLFDANQFSTVESQLTQNGVFKSGSSSTTLQEKFDSGSQIQWAGQNAVFKIDISIISISSPDLATVQTVDVGGESIQYIPNYSGFSAPKSTGTNIDRKIIATTNDYIDVTNGRILNEDKILKLINRVYAAKGSYTNNWNLYVEVSNAVHNAWVNERIITSNHATNLNNILKG